MPFNTYPSLVSDNPSAIKSLFAFIFLSTSVGHVRVSLNVFAGFATIATNSANVCLAILQVLARVECETCTSHQCKHALTDLVVVKALTIWKGDFGYIPGKISVLLSPQKRFPKM